jgi:TRAP-type mannitol/chloroaromatic compound transport system permease small subunit
MSFVQNEASSNPGGLEYRYLVKALMPLSFAFLLLEALKEAKTNFSTWKSL